tara:strand:- start:2295 stop:2462 length:168 start_codon:yes stop_codon:yes gene_type:complete
MSGSKLILKKLNNIQSELNTIKKRVVDVDLVMTDDDNESIKRAESDLKEGKTKRL